MNTHSHTPGPWSINPQVGGNRLQVTGHSNGISSVIVAETGLAFGPSIPRIEADARLIAAAPDLLAALQWALGAMAPPIHESSEYAVNHRHALDSVAKALGRD